jgi:hypothetical protein
MNKSINQEEQEVWKMSCYEKNEQFQMYLFAILNICFQANFIFF